MTRSFDSNLALFLIALLIHLLVTFNNGINYSVTRFGPPVVRSEEEERVVENGSLQAFCRASRQGGSDSARFLRGGLYADR